MKFNLQATLYNGTTKHMTEKKHSLNPNGANSPDQRGKPNYQDTRPKNPPMQSISTETQTQRTINTVSH
jgi:hypothetical protein